MELNALFLPRKWNNEHFMLLKFHILYGRALFYKMCTYYTQWNCATMFYLQSNAIYNAKLHGMLLKERKEVINEIYVS